MKKVLIAPLNWGIGHATRCVPIIEMLMGLGAEVVLAGHGLVYDFFNNRYPGLELIMLPGHIVSYQTRGRRLMLPVVKGLPGYALSLYKEHQILKNLVTTHKIGFIISDNRYGLWHPDIPSVLITHQIKVRINGLWKLGLPMVRMTTHWFFHPFDEIWIPDYAPQPGLAGQLSHPRHTPNKFKYIGPLSRFDKPAPKLPHPQYDFLALVSGPEPQRTIFENILIRLFHSGPYKTIILRGLPGHADIIRKSPYLTLISHLPDDQFYDLVRNSAQIICRPGYSTLMDLMALQRQAVLVPTPGQPEQEYLASLHRTNSQFRVFSQKEIEILPPQAFIMPETSLVETQKYNPEILEKTCSTLLKIL